MIRRSRHDFRWAAARQGPIWPTRSHFGPSRIQFPMQAQQFSISTMSDAGEDDSRDIFNGSIDSIVDVLMQFAKEDNVTICGYKDEAKTTSKAKVVHGKRGVVAQANVPAALRSLQENLAFRKKDIKKACKKTHKQMRKNTSAKSPWNEMSEQEISDWVETHVRRIRNINRIISQNENKKRGHRGWKSCLGTNRTRLLLETSPRSPV